ncbi:hypothetical protein [Methanoregula sp.]|uniref:hypothetical protein n=1 Tax=Methanoregula sp. TaxID=2052170 RepID=UPI000CB817EC|nr:hypothetical protein [Methanoregula sp.]PKG31367.1 MAG: hypothetical protein CW742_13780 [Methanoregula sp.]
MKRFNIPVILQALIFLIPLNIYVIGDWMGSGIQTIFFRYMQTNIGDSLIFLNRELHFILKGIVTGKTAIATSIWLIGVAIILIATLLVILAYRQQNPRLLRHGAYLNAAGALLFSISIVIQYGILLHGPAGIAIPLGIPVILSVAYFQYKSVENDPDPEPDGEGEGADDAEDDDEPGVGSGVQSSDPEEPLR